MEPLDSNNSRMLDAVAFAARAHQGQIRKDGKTPYASHVFRVCLILRHVFGFDDPAMLTAALLHDTIEDTTTDFDDLKSRYGEEVASWVASLTKDKRLEDDEREQHYRAALAAAPWQVKACKLADVCDNLLDSHSLSGDQRQRTLLRARLYLAALDQPQLPERVRRAHQIVTRLLADIENTLA
jgi:guanosine-3',5'-bis(diphosphate) 3'-pyrophosphohydrolase